MGTDGRQFELTPKVLDLGYAYLSSLGIGEIAQPSMEALSEQVHESVSVAVLDGDEIVYVARVPTKRIMTISLVARLPPARRHHLDGSGAAGRPRAGRPRRLPRPGASHRPAPSAPSPTSAELRDELAEVRRQGFALVDQELEDGVRSIATALRDRRGRAVAAINVSTHAGRVSLKELRGHVPARAPEHRRRDQRPPRQALTGRPASAGWGPRRGGRVGRARGVGTVGGERPDRHGRQLGHDVVHVGRVGQHAPEVGHALVGQARRPGPGTPPGDRTARPRLAGRSPGTWDRGRPAPRPRPRSGRWTRARCGPRVRRSRAAPPRPPGCTTAGDVGRHHLVEWPRPRRSRPGRTAERGGAPRPARRPPPHRAARAGRAAGSPLEPLGSPPCCWPSCGLSVFAERTNVRPAHRA